MPSTNLSPDREPLAQEARQSLADVGPVHQAKVLTGGGQVAFIDLDGQIYQMRITRQGKLILTK